jgi:hypothetical protein
MELVTRHWSGKQRRVVQGINLMTLLWTQGDSHIPSDYRLYEKSVDGKTKNDHFRSMLQTAKARQFSPQYIVFDSWYSSLDNLKLIRSYGWIWLTRFHSNRHVNPERTSNRPIAEVEIAASGTIVHLKGYVMVKVFKLVTPDGNVDYWATNHLSLPELQRLQFAEFAWTIEQYHYGLKQSCEAQQAQVRPSKAQRNHIGLSIRAFLRLSIVRDAVRAYLAGLATLSI